MSNPVPTCYTESRLQLGLKEDYSAIVGSLDRVSIQPIPLDKAVKANETRTSLRYDPELRALIYVGESAKRTGGSPDYIEARELLSGATIEELGGVGDLGAGGIPVVALVDGQLTVVGVAPAPIETGEVSGGFLTYVAEPNDGLSHVRLLRPDTNGANDSLLLGRPDGSLEFAPPIVSPLVVPVDTLTSSGIFTGAPAVATGGYRYQTMGTTQVVSNTSGSPVEVTLNFYFALVTAGSHNGVYAKLVNGGSDFKTTFINGANNVKQEGYPGGYAEFRVVLAPNEKCSIEFGAWTDGDSGNIEATIGSSDEAGKTAYAPTISIRRLI